MHGLKQCQGKNPMRIPRYVFRALATELDANLRDGVIQAVDLPEPHRLRFRARAPGFYGAVILQVLPGRAGAWIASGRHKVGVIRGGSRFAVDVARNLSGSRIESVRQWGFERQLVFTLQRPDDQSRLELHLEAFGNAPNLILVRLPDQALVCAARYGEKSGLRAGGIYTPQTTPDLLDPGSAEWTLRALEILRAADGPGALRRAADRVGIPEGMAAELLAMDRDEPDAVEAQGERLRGILFSPAAPCLVDSADRETEIWPFLPDAPRFNLQKRFTRYSPLVEYVQDLLHPSDLETLRNSLMGVLKRERRTAQSRRDNILGDLEEAADFETCRLRGEMILAWAHTLPPGTGSATVPGPEGETLTIPLDAERSAADNAQTYFDQYKRLKRKRAVAEQRLAECDRLLAEMDEGLARLGAATDAESLREAGRSVAMAAPGVLPLLQETPKGKTRRNAQEEANPFPFARLFYSADGCRLFVGKDAKGNDALVRRAHGNDLWFHAEGVQGSHVLVKRDGRRGEIPWETIRDAAQLAAHYSAFRGDSQAVIHYTECKYVRKPKGLPPGKVLYSQQKSVIVGVDEARMERLATSVQAHQIRQLATD